MINGGFLDFDYKIIGAGSDGCVVAIDISDDLSSSIN